MADLTTKITAIQEDVLLMQAKAQAITVSDDIEYQTATGFLGELSGRMKRIETLRKEFTQPLKDQVKVIDNTFKMQLEPLEKADEIIREKMKVFYMEKQKKAQVEEMRLAKEAEEQEIKRQEALQLLEEEKAKATPEQQKEIEDQIQMVEEFNVEVVPVAEPERTVRSEQGTSTVQMRWTFEITDESKIPQSFKVFDSALMRKFISAGGRECDGVRIYQDAVISIR